MIKENHSGENIDQLILFLNKIENQRTVGESKFPYYIKQ